MDSHTGPLFNTQVQDSDCFTSELLQTGVKFSIEATYRGKRVQPSVVPWPMGKMLTPGEFAIFTTSTGAGWESSIGKWNSWPYTVITKKNGRR